MMKSEPTNCLADDTRQSLLLSVTHNTNTTNKLLRTLTTEENNINIWKTIF